MLHAPKIKAYAMLVTFQKTERDLCAGYTILLFARHIKQRNATVVPFTYLGPADLEQHESERPTRWTYSLTKSTIILHVE